MNKIGKRLSPGRGEMENSEYTANEMRDFADAIAGDLSDNGHRYVSYGFSELLPIIQSLRYAADVVERANERRGVFAANYGRIDYEHDSAIVDEIDYILRGDAGKEER